MLGRLLGTSHACVLLHEVKAIGPIDADLHLCPTGDCCICVCCHRSIRLTPNIDYVGLWHHRKTTKKPKRSTKAGCSPHLKTLRLV